MPLRSAPASLILALGVAVALGAFRGASARAGSAAALYQELCATCHGSDGQGAEGYEEPLAGDLSIAALAQLIERTMPEGEPEACVGDEARQVAEYVYNEFYSLEARQRKGLVVAPRIELARLTVSQYQNAVADLIGHFTEAPADEPNRPEDSQSDSDSRDVPESGLRAQYFQSKGMNKADNLQQQRIDRYVDFDFGQGSPVEGIEPDQFAIIWEGALIANETGEYGFRIRTENGARLYVNPHGPGLGGKLRDDSSAAGEAALIDGWVSSGEMRELTARRFLIGGRRYPLRLEFFKYLQETASIRLEWKPPHGAWAVLDHNHLTTDSAARVFVVETPFPADDRSAGYERGSSASLAWHTATTNAAVATAAEVIDRLPQLARLEGEGDHQETLKEFVARFASVAFRRPLTEEEDRLYRELLFSEATDPKVAVRRAILLVLKSPHFLYTDLTPVDQPPSQYTIAARLAFTLWDSIPDQPLLDAARNGQLATAEQIEAQARRMLDSPRARAKMRDFFHHWLEIGERDLAKDKDQFPEFDEATFADLRFSLERFVEQVVWSEESDYRQLLLADHLVLNERLRRLYQPQHEDASGRAADETPSPDAGSPDAGSPDDRPDSEFQAVAFDPDQRAGLLTHPYLLSAFAYHNNSSPIHRGVFLARTIVGRGLRPPPVAVAFKDDEFDPDLTMREKITQLTSDTACTSCHSVINPLGFALEHYDAVGRWRATDNRKPINAVAEYATIEGETVKFHNAREVAEFAAASESAQRAFITDTFHHLVKQSPSAYGQDLIDRLHEQFVSDDYNIQKLWIRIAAITANHWRTVTPERDTDS